MMPDTNEITTLLYSLAKGRIYHPARYSCVTEFVPSFPRSETVKKFVPDPTEAKPQWQPEPPYPRYYTDSYKKTILSSL
jgi:hypothetical protein